MMAKRATPPSQLGLGLNLSTKKTRKREFLDEMDRVIPWDALVQIVEPHSPRAKTGRPPFAIETMLRIHYLQQHLVQAEWPKPNLYGRWVELNAFRIGKLAQKIQERSLTLQMFRYGLTSRRAIEVLEAIGRRPAKI
jgi:hypothetical protein